MREGKKQFERQKRDALPIVGSDCGFSEMVGYVEGA